MSDRMRLVMLVLSALMLAPAAYKLALAMPHFGAHPLPYGDAVNALAPKQRLVTNAVTAVNFDYRGFDTLGEEFMLLAAVTGTVVLLRGSRGEGTTDRPARVPGRAVERRADATTAVTRIGAWVLLLFGLYMALHGTVTPGGGFQGGAVIASALLLVYLGDGYAPWRRVLAGPLFACIEAVGALAFVGAALWPLAHGDAALANRLPHGEWKDLFSGGLMVVSNLAVAAAVAGSFTVLLTEAIEETRAIRSGEDDEAEDPPARAAQP